MTALLLAFTLSQTPTFLGPYTRLGTQPNSSLLDGGATLRGSLVFSTDGGPGAVSSYDGRYWTEALTATTAPMNLYVSVDGGVDTNDCATAATPCLTVQAAVDRIPYWVRHAVKVNVEAGVYTGNVVISGRRIGARSATGIPSGAGYTYPSITIEGSNTWTAASVTGGATGTVTAYTDPVTGVEGVLTDSGKAWTPVVGVATNFVRMTSGASSGRRSVVTANSATDLYVNRPLAAAISDTYQVENPSTVIVGRIVVENITGDSDTQSTAVLFSRLYVTDAGAAATNDPWIGVRNVPRPASHNSIAGSTSGDFEVYRPTTAVAFSECYILLTQTPSIAIRCEQGSCGFRGPNRVSTSAYWGLYAKDADLDLGAVYMTDGYATNGRALVLDNVRLQAGLYTRTTGLVEGAFEIETLFPVVEASGSSGYAIDGTYVTSTLNALMLRGGRATGAPGSYCMRLKQSSVSMTYFTCDDLLGLSGFQPAFAAWLTDRTFAYFNGVTANVSNTTLRVEYGSRIHSFASPPSSGALLDMTIDGVAYTFASIEALTPRYVEGIMGSQYVRQ